jgi:PIN domain nuclease of toxin-antitoxin system
MRYLVDTHAFLWAIGSPEMLSHRVRTILEDPRAELLISIATPWEIAIKAGIGKLNHAEEVLDNFTSLMAAGGYRILETSAKEVIRGGRLPLHHKDPFDRLLVAQALELSVPIISSDEVLDRYGVRRVWQ